MRWAAATSDAHDIAPNAYITEFVQGTHYLAAIQRWTSQLLEEMEGIARGADQPWAWIHTCNLLDEEWTWTSACWLDPTPGCMVAGFAGQGGPPPLAQTMDINTFHNDT